MEFKVILVPSFKNEIEKIRDRKQLEIIDKAVNKLENMGINALKILHVQNGYLLGEIKSNRPPYRLYVIIDQSSNVFYVVNWSHKHEQRKVIGRLTYKLSCALNLGINDVADLFAE